MEIQLNNKTPYQLPTLEEISKNCQARYKNLKNAVKEKLDNTSFDKEAFLDNLKENKAQFGTAAVSAIVTPVAIYSLFSNSTVDAPVYCDDTISTEANKTNNQSATFPSSFNISYFNDWSLTETVAAFAVTAGIVLGVSVCLCGKKSKTDSDTITLRFSSPETIQARQREQQEQARQRQQQEETQRRQQQEETQRRQQPHAQQREHLQAQRRQQPHAQQREHLQAQRRQQPHAQQREHLQAQQRQQQESQQRELQQAQQREQLQAQQREQLQAQQREQAAEQRLQRVQQLNSKIDTIIAQNFFTNVKAKAIANLNVFGNVKARTAFRDQLLAIFNDRSKSHPSDIFGEFLKQDFPEKEILFKISLLMGEALKNFEEIEDLNGQDKVDHIIACRDCFFNQIAEIESTTSQGNTSLLNELLAKTLIKECHSKIKEAEKAKEQDRIENESRNTLSSALSLKTVLGDTHEAFGQFGSPRLSPTTRNFPGLKSFSLDSKPSETKTEDTDETNSDQLEPTLIPRPLLPEHSPLTLPVTSEADGNPEKIKPEVADALYS